MCKFHPEVYQRYTKKRGHRVRNPIFGQELKCPVCGTKVVIGEPHPESRARRTGYLGYLIPEIPPTTRKDLDASGWVRENLMVNDDSPLLWAALARRPKKNPPKDEFLHDQAVTNEDRSQTLYGMTITDIDDADGVIMGETWIEYLDQHFTVMKIGGSLWQIHSMTDDGFSMEEVDDE